MMCRIVCPRFFLTNRGKITFIQAIIFLGSLYGNFPTENYQDVYIQGDVVSRGTRECERRYEVVKNFCAHYERPITVLDIGANLGYFSFRLADEIPGSYVLIEKESQDLLKLCEQNENERIIVLNRQITLKELKSLAEVEHFDVVLGLDVIQYFKEPLQKVLETLMRLGDYLFLEYPTSCNSAYRKVPLFFTPSTFSEGLYLIECPKKTLKRAFWKRKRAFSKSPVIESTFARKTIGFRHKKEASRDWHEGINFSTFLALNGQFPTKESILRLLRGIDPQPLTDLRPWNFILDGETLQPIDFVDPNFTNKTSLADLRKIIDDFTQDRLSPNSF